MSKKLVLFSSAALSWLENLLNERFGHEFLLVQAGSSLVLRVAGSDFKIRFKNLQAVFHESRSDFPCEKWCATSEGFAGPIAAEIPAPSTEKLPDPVIQITKLGAIIGYDVLGLCYWMLSRLEEVDRLDLDTHGRFPAKASHAFINGYLDRPIVDEWLIILGQVIQRVWPQLKLVEHQFRIQVSHDVDRPSLYAFQPWSAIVRMMAGHLIKRRDLKAFLQAPQVKLSMRDRLHPKDPFNTFDWLMDVSEENGIRSAFYFICGRTNPRYDADYDPEQPAIRELMRRIHERGHEIGLHPSYDTFKTPELIKEEAERLKRICHEEGIKQEEWGGRMHYLRWCQPVTLRAWDYAGLDYDSSLGYADMAGFRCGTSQEFNAFDPVDQHSLRLRVRPLIAMEKLLLDEYRDEGLFEKCDALPSIVINTRKVSGYFNLLWHNSNFLNYKELSIYQDILSVRGV